jgi:integrase
VPRSVNGSPACQSADPDGERFSLRPNDHQLHRLAANECTTGVGGTLSRQYVSAMLRRRAIKADIDKLVHPHGLRHTDGAELAAEGVPINVISKQLGHASSANTARYIDRTAPPDVIAAIQARTWTEPGH